MKTAAMRWTAAVGLMLGAACISLKIPAVFPGGDRVDRMVICSSVAFDKGLYEPRDITSDFRLRDGRVICHVRLNDVGRELRLRWRWYDPGGRLFRDTGDLLVNIEERFLSVLTVTDILELAEGWDDDTLGRWTIVFSVDDIQVESLDFRIDRN